MADQTDSEREAAVLEALDRWLAAARDGDIAVLEQLLTDNFSYTHASNGNLDHRAQWLEIFRPGSATYRRYRAYEVTDPWVRLFPGTAIVFGKGHQEIVRPTGEEVDLNTTFTCIWVEQDGSWRLAAWQATRIPDS